MAFAAMDGRRRFNPSEALVICADPRGGSTSLAEVLNRIQGTTMFWGPLNIDETETFQDLGNSYRQFLPDDDDVPQIRDRFESLFSGSIIDPYVMHHRIEVALAQSGARLKTTSTP